MLKFLKILFPMMLMVDGGGAGGAGGGAAAGAAAGGGAAAGSAGAAPAAAGAAASGGAAPAAAGAAGALTAGPAGGGAAAAAAAAPATDWTTGLPELDVGYVQNKGWKSPADALNSYRNLEKHIGVSPDQLIRLPKADASEAEATAAMNSLYDRLGRPATPDGYKIEIPKEHGSPEFAKGAADAFHKAGLSDKQAKAVTDFFNGFASETLKTRGAEYEAKVEQGRTNLKKDWGAAFDENSRQARTAVKEFVTDPKIIDAIESVVGYDGCLKFFQSLGSKIGTDPRFHTGGTSANPNAPMTPAAAKAKLAELRADAGWVKKWASGDASARAEVNRLNKFMIGESA